MKDAHLLLSKLADAFGQYLRDQTCIGIGVLDGRGRLVRCNARLEEMLGLPKEAMGRQLGSLVSLADRGELELPPEGSSWVVNLRPCGDKGGRETVHCHVHNQDSRCLLVADRVPEPDEGYMEQVTRLNSKLTDLNRELQKKKRALEKARDRIAKMARTDELTRLPNRRAFNTELERDVSRAHRHDQPLSLAIADLDRFKGINDTYGHDVGDEVLKSFGKVLREECRAEDVPARWGGEEFVVLMPDTTAEDAANLSERIRSRFAELPHEGIDRVVTASFGVAGLRGSEEGADLLRAADAALYRAKESGRDRVVIARTED